MPNIRAVLRGGPSDIRGLPMTTIAYRDGVLAADRLITSGTLRCGEMRKIATNEAGWLCGCAGPITASAIVLAWIEAGAEGEPPEAKEADAIIVSPDGAVHFWTGYGPLTRAHGDFFAVGSGERIAVGAMAAGASAIDAVRIAIAHDTATGGPVDYLTLGSR